MNRLRRTAALWIFTALVAVFFRVAVATLPMPAGPLAVDEANASSLWLQICTAAGIQTIAGDSRAEDGNSSTGLPLCEICISLGVASLALEVTAPVDLLPRSLPLRRLRPVQAALHVLRPVDRAARPRAPPPFAV